METLKVTQIKQNFDDYLIKVQKHPVAIEKNGKPVAITMSMDEYRLIKDYKLQHLKDEIKVGLDQIENGEVVDGEQVFGELLNEATP